MVDVASLICFTKLCKNILILTKPRANAQRVVKSVVIPNVQVGSVTSANMDVISNSMDIMQLWTEYGAAM